MLADSTRASIAKSETGHHRPGRRRPANPGTATRSSSPSSRQVAKAYPRVPLHVVCDNYATHKHPTVKAWLAKNPRVTMHFTPTSCSWLNLVECFFSIITRQAIRRGTYTSVADLTDAIEAYIDGWNEQAHPFTWTKTADELLRKIESAKTKTSRLTVH